MNNAAAQQPVVEPPFYGRILLLISILSGIGLSVPCLTAGPLAMDEYGTYWIASDGPLTMWERSLNYENIPPFAPWLHRVILNVLGESEFTFRVPTTLCYVLAIYVSYLVGREFAGTTFGGLVALVTAWHPSALPEVMFARCYGVTLLLSALCFLFAVRWYKAPYDYLWAFFWTLACIALVWTHYLNATVVIATMPVLAWRVRRNDRGVVFFIIASLAMLFTVSPLYSPLVRMSVWGKYFGYQKEAPILETIGPLWWAGLPVGFVVGWLASHRMPLGKKGEVNPHSVGHFSRSAFVILLLWGLLPTALVAVVCHGEYASLANPRYRVGFDIATACFLVAMFRSRMGLRPTMVATVVMLTGAWLFCPSAPWEPRRLLSAASAEWKEMALKIEKEGRAGQPIFVQSGFGESFLMSDLFDDQTLHDFAACRLGRFYLKTEHPRYALPFIWNTKTSAHRQFHSLLTRMAAAKQDTIWLVAATDTDLSDASSRHFEETARFVGYEPAEQVELPSVRLIRFELHGESTP